MGGEHGAGRAGASVVVTAWEVWFSVEPLECPEVYGGLPCLELE